MALYSEDLCVLSSLFRSTFKVLIDIFGLILSITFAAVFSLLYLYRAFVLFLAVRGLCCELGPLPGFRAQAPHGGGPLAAEHGLQAHGPQ